MVTVENAPGLKILVAEDNSVNQTLIMLMLKQLGYQATLAQNGLEVLAAFQHTCYELVLMDVQMPQMDGLTATRQLRQTQALAQPYIVAMTANYAQSDLRDYAAAGMNGHLSKPIQLEALATLLKTCQTATHPAASAFATTDPPAPAAAQAESLVCLDRQILANLCRDLGLHSPSALNALIDCYLAEAPQQIQALRRATSEQNSQNNKEIHRIAHTLKSSSRTLGAIQLAQLCQQLEEWGRLGTLEPVAAALSDLDQEFERFKAALEQERQ